MPHDVRLPPGAALVTGASGFIGHAVVASLLDGDQEVRVLVRQPGRTPGARPGRVRAWAGDLLDAETLQRACQGAATVFHCAGYAHASRTASPEEAARHWRVNAEGTRNLVEAAGEAGVQRFVFLSTVKAVGEPGANCVDESWDAPPATPYGQAKRQAEAWVLEAGERYGMHVVNLRLAMVYGPGGRGNLPKMVEAIRRGRFPSLPQVRNRRSMVHVEDVVQAAMLAVTRPEAAGRTYIVTDGVDYSTGEIYRRIRAALGLPPARRAFPLPLLRVLARAGDLLRAARLPTPLDSDTLLKLVGSECYRSDRIRRELGFRPTHTLWDALPEIAGAPPAVHAA